MKRRIRKRKTYPTNQPNCKVCARAMSRCGRGTSGGGAMIVAVLFFYSLIFFFLPCGEGTCMSLRIPLS